MNLSYFLMFWLTAVEAVQQQADVQVRHDALQSHGHHHQEVLLRHALLHAPVQQDDGHGRRRRRRERVRHDGTWYTIAMEDLWVRFVKCSTTVTNI